MQPLIVHVSDLVKTHRAGETATPALRGVSFSLARGSFTAIVGPSGCGKSTLLGILGGIEEPDAGRVSVAGFDVARAGSRELVSYRRHVVGIVFQSFNLLPSLTAAENVESGLELTGVRTPERRRRARDLLARMGLQHVFNRLPSQLSGGEQQRVAVARALVRNPLLLLADEPTGNLDEESGSLVFDTMRSLQSDLGTTCLMVTHSSELAARADSIIRMRDGRIVDEDSGLRLAAGFR